jgi:photosystem II stability/assembly factor-like uncharacterized protein
VGLPKEFCLVSFVSTFCGSEKLRYRMVIHFASFKQLFFIFVVLLFNVAASSASDWRTVELPARALGIAENNGALWVCGADELIATSVDGGNTWTVKHNAKNGSLLLTVGFSDEQFGYAAGT